jgi:signal transduction histidine kinase
VFIRISPAEKGQLLIRVEDDGQGLPAAVGEDADGLLNLRKRMAALGGVCEIGVRDGGGVAVRLSVPLAGADK